MSDELTKAEEPSRSDHGLDLCVVLDYNITMLKLLQKIDFSDLYEQAQEDKIKCVTGFYNVISATQKALIKQIKEQ